MNFAPVFLFFRASSFCEAVTSAEMELESLNPRFTRTPPREDVKLMFGSRIFAALNFAPPEDVKVPWLVKLRTLGNPGMVA